MPSTLNIPNMPSTFIILTIFIRIVTYNNLYSIITIIFIFTKIIKKKKKI